MGLVINMIFDAYGRPVRNIEPVVDEMLSNGVEYRVVPKDEVGYAERQLSYQGYLFTRGDRTEKMAVIEKDENVVGENVPERFRPIVAAHEFGHGKGLTHAEIFRLELAAADESARVTSDPTLKEDYLRWSSSNEWFQKVKGNRGHEAEREAWDYPETVYRDIMEKCDARGVLVKDGDRFIQIF